MKPVNVGIVMRIHPEFKAFLGIFDSGQPIQLGKQDYPCSDRMLEAINSIIYSYYDPVLRAMTLEGYVMIILAEAFHAAFYNNIPPSQKIMLQSHQYEQVKKAHHYILTEGFNNPLTNAHLCEKFMLPKAILLQGFRELYNCSPQKLARKSRYDQIKGLLLQGYTPTEVARKANFENDTYFYNAFQKYCGCTPAEFQNRNIKKILFIVLKILFRSPLFPGSCNFGSWQNHNHINSLSYLIRTGASRFGQNKFFIYSRTATIVRS